MELNILFYIGLMLAAGLLFGRLAKLVRLPNVTGYLIAGLLIGPYVLNIVPADIVDGLDIISDIALAFIALSIGGEFKLSYFRRVGMSPVIIAVFEGLFAILFVVAALVLAGFELPFSLVLGSIAAATAPAATIMVIRQYRAKGPVTETLMSVVALDDAVALVGFGFAVTIAKSITSGAAFSLMSILEPLYEVGVSFALGGLLGFLLTLPMRWFKKDSNRLCIVAGITFLAVGLSDLVGGSSLLTCMSMGAVFINLAKDGENVMRIAEYTTPPILMLFFVSSGAALNIGVLPTIGIVGILYVVMRVVGKLAGAWFGAVISKAPKAVRRYLGPALIPQAGVAIGLSLVANTVVPEHAAVIRAVVLCGTLIYELVGPVISKITLTKAGEIKPQ